MKFGNYTINNPESFETPEYVIFENILQHNIDTILSMVKTPSRLIPHAKTHKSREMLNFQIARGITRHKTSTLEEIQILSECNPEELILAYPLASEIKAKRYSEIINQNKNIKYSAIAGTVYHLDILSQIENLEDEKVWLDWLSQYSIQIKKNKESSLTEKRKWVETLVSLMQL